jgi:hypothetical protein
MRSFTLTTTGAGISPALTSDTLKNRPIRIEKILVIDNSFLWLNKD